MKNNLFWYATSELSQDAFICWLSSFALEDSRPDPALGECARELLTLFVPEFAGKDVKLLEVARQVDDMDVLLTAQCDGVLYKIIVEDKTYTREHSSQLERYREQVARQHENCQVRGVYYKTGFQSNLRDIEERGYYAVTREDMLALMEPYLDKTQSDIFHDYYARWDYCQQLADSHKTTPVNAWGWWQAYGFFDALHKEMPEGIWSKYQYVSNPAGGFDCFVFGSNHYEISVEGVPCELYMHLEFHNGGQNQSFKLLITLKLGINTPKAELESQGSSFAKIRDRLIFDHSWNYTLGKYHFTRPARLGSGAHITLGVYEGDCSDAGQCRKTLQSAICDYQLLLDDWK